MSQLICLNVRNVILKDSDEIAIRDKKNSWKPFNAVLTTFQIVNITALFLGQQYERLKVLAASSLQEKCRPGQEKYDGRNIFRYFNIIQICIVVNQNKMKCFRFTRFNMRLKISGFCCWVLKGPSLVVFTFILPNLPWLLCFLIMCWASIDLPSQL